MLTAATGKDLQDWGETVLWFWEQSLLKIKVKIGPW